MKIKTLLEKLFTGEEKTLNARNNEIQRTFYPTSRYLVDFAEGTFTEGWEQFDTDQDANYFGFWVNRRTLQTLTYCEGDWSLVTCDNSGCYNAEIADAIEFYNPGFEFKTIGPEGITIYRQTRKHFFIG